MSGAAKDRRLEAAVDVAGNAVVAMPDDDRGRTHSACCATCRWWGVDDSGVGGECERARRRPVSLMGVWSVSQPGSECHAGFWTEPAFGCAAWERRDSGPQDAPESSQGPDYRDGGFRRVAGRLR